MTLKSKSITGMVSLILMGLTGLAQGLEARELSRQEAQGRVHEWAQRQGVDWHFLAAVVEVESNFRTRAVSSAGAQGLMQLMPQIQSTYGVTDPFDPWQNLAAGTAYLRRLIRTFDSVRQGLWAYHGGPSRVRQNRVPASSQRYANRVLRAFWRRKAEEEGHVR